MGYAATVPWMSIFVAVLLAGRLSDALLRAGYRRFVARNLLVIVGFALAGVFLYPSSVADTLWAAVWLLSIALGFAGFTSTVPWAIATDIGGEHTSVVAGWMNMWGFAGAAVMPAVSAIVGTRYGWKTTLVVLAVLALLGIGAMLLVNPDRPLRPATAGADPR